jgi:four helix bundle protein
MSKIEKFEDIEAWKNAREIAKYVYSISSKDVFSKDFALVNQMRRASVSILSNIAEGFERNGDKEFVQFLLIAKGSCGELRAQLYIALDQNYIDQNSFMSINSKLNETSRMIAGLIKYLRGSELKGARYKIVDTGE